MIRLQGATGGQSVREMQLLTRMSVQRSRGLKGLQTMMNFVESCGTSDTSTSCSMRAHACAGYVVL